MKIIDTSPTFVHYILMMLELFYANYFICISYDKIEETKKNIFPDKNRPSFFLSDIRSLT